MISALAVIVLLTSATPAGWSPIGFQASVGVTALNHAVLFTDVALYVTLGPAPRSSAQTDELRGWRVQLGVAAGAGLLGGDLCERFCAERIFAGPSLRLGWLHGYAIGATGPFGRLEVLGGHALRSSAPLSPGLDAFELLTRLQLGWQWAPPSPAHDGWTFFFATVMEVQALSGETQGLVLGLSLGAGL